MGLLDRVLTPRGNRKPGASSHLTLSLPEVEACPESPRDATASTPRRSSLRLGKLVSAAGRMLTPRGGRPRGDGELVEGPFSSPRPGASEAQRIQAYRPTLTGLMEQQLRLSGQLTTPHQRPALETAISVRDSDAASEADSDVSSLDGFGDYARKLASEKRTGMAAGDEEASPAGSSASCPADQQDSLQSAGQQLAQLQLSSPRLTARDSQRAAEDLQLLLQAGELPSSRQRLARLLVHADGLGAEAFAGLSLHQLGFERCVALLLQLLLLLPLHSRSGALTQLQSQLSGQLMSYLGSALERVLESERACQRFCRLPFEVASWLLEHGPCDRGETLFDLANLWLEQQRKDAQPEQQRALASLLWRRPVAADFLACMAANLPWAAEHVATSALRPARAPSTLDGRFSFTAEFDLHDFLELQHAAMAEGRPQQQQSPAMYCGGYCWWAVLSANPRHNRFELYASCSPFALFQEPFRAALQPAADVRFSFQGKTSLVDWKQTNQQRLAAMHTHWGGAAFRAPADSLAAQAVGSPGASPSGSQYAPGLGPVAAAARPDTARGPRPSRQPSRLSVSSSGSLHSAAVAAAAAVGAPSPLGGASSRSLGRAGSGLAGSPRGSFTSGGQLTPGYLSMADSGPPTARQLEPAGGLLQLSMEQVVAEVRRSCPYSWGASLRVRVHIKLLG